jgi:hydroxyethylthiazole kinase-like sugar kinase family protein
MFFFAKEVKEGALDAVPEGYSVVEMKTGMPVLKKIVAAPSEEQPADAAQTSS